MQIGGFEPNSGTYMIVVDGFYKIGDFEEGLKVLNVVLNSEDFPHAETFLFFGYWLRQGWKNE